MSTDAVQRIADHLDLDQRVAPYRDRIWHPGSPPAPVLHLEDVSAIPFLVDIAGVEEYQHRARMRAADGDLYATVTATDPGYESYCRDRLGLGVPTHLLVDPRGDAGPLAVTRACMADAALSTLVDHTRHSGLVLHPYMSIGDVWVLAAAIAAGADRAVTVIGAPPPVTWIANDKALFDELVAAVLGPGWSPETHVETEPARMAARLRDLADRYRTVGLKRTRCASAMGNQVFDAATLAAETASIEQHVRAFLARTEWPGTEPVLVVAWEDAAASPSTQWWLPPMGHGPPRLDGIYEQILEGDRKMFVGSRPSALPRSVEAGLTDAGARVAGALQRLGYVGRCSFDHLVVGDPRGDFELHFTECNGRWGGTSTPMHLVDRLVRGPRPPYRAQDFSHPALIGAAFADVIAAVGDRAFDHPRQHGQFIFYNVGPLERHGKLDVIALGRTQSEAEHALGDDLPRLLRL